MSDNIFSIENQEPDFINEQGTSWWRLKDAHNYANRGDIKLDKYNFWLVKNKDGMKSYIVTEGSKYVYSTPSLEALGVFIDKEIFLIRQAMLPTASGLY